MWEKHEAPGMLGGGCNNEDSLINRQKENTRNCAAPQCISCRFYAEIPLKTGRIRRLCRLNGECNPSIRMAGCVFVRAAQGEIGGLTESSYPNKLNFPNCKRPCNRLAPQGQKVALHTSAIHAFAENIGRTLHIGGAQRPHDREAAAASYRPGSVVAPPFCF